MEYQLTEGVQEAKSCGEIFTKFLSIVYIPAGHGSHDTSNHVVIDTSVPLHLVAEYPQCTLESR